MGSFVTSDEVVDIAVLVVTYNSADHVDALIDSLRAEAEDVSVRMVVADNSSRDATLTTLRSHDDVRVISTGGNLGYAGGINVAAEHAGAARALLVLNPDLRVGRGSLRTLLTTLQSRHSAGVVAPRILDAEGHTSTSIYNEPGIVRALGDALLGSMWRRRPSLLSEWDRRPRAYVRGRRTDWVTGAALLISARAAEIVGIWDERFFLYSEETDYCRRVRDSGFEVWFDPAAVVHHSQGGSGSSPELDALLTVNRVRYMRKHAPARANLYRLVAFFGATLRSGRSESHRLSAAMLRDENRWAELPRATVDETQGSGREGQ